MQVLARRRSHATAHGLARHRDRARPRRGRLRSAELVRLERRSRRSAWPWRGCGRRRFVSSSLAAALRRVLLPPLACATASRERGAPVLLDALAWHCRPPVADLTRRLLTRTKTVLRRMLSVRRTVRSRSNDVPSVRVRSARRPRLPLGIVRRPGSRPSQGRGSRRCAPQACGRSPP